MCIRDSLRAAYELPTPEHHEGVYAYYFYRLIQRAKTVHMPYCSHADDKSTGEPSRYIYQLDYESGFDVAEKSRRRERRRALGVDETLQPDHHPFVLGHLDRRRFGQVVVFISYQPEICI